MKRRKDKIWINWNATQYNRAAAQGVAFGIAKTKRL